MARIRLVVDDLPLRLTLKVMLEAEGHAFTDSEAAADLCIAEKTTHAVAAVATGPSLVLASQASLPEAVQAMRRGVFGYIAVPLIPGEAPLMVQRALGSTAKRDDSLETVRLEDIERTHIEAVLRRCKHNQAEAARLLGIGRNTLWRKLKQYNTAEHPALGA